ncbi:hypothetical protein FUAX_10200 [Fulvitalea axinellae]|uniref:Putative auto-transporter adhesin head GIN domain-containing protein n=1 Tax=Fulvitalea axinellae TaxID=1182444 RepID=A0AAU9CY69_9BACT|nr:hypothetical protein FUAX_10200 [Fulvitalea axinellae]
MKHTAFFIALLFLAFTASAQHDVDRPVSSFSKIRVFNKVKVHLVKGSKISVRIKTNDNITTQDVVTEVKNNELKIKLRTKVYRDIKVDAYVTYTDLQELSASAGGKIVSNGTMEVDNLTVEAGAGARIEIPVTADFITASASSGGEISLKGSANNLKATAGSGGVIDTYHLKAKEAYVKANTGGHVDVQPLEVLEARAYTGGIVNYKGNPKKLDTKKSVGGTINQQ